MPAVIILILLFRDRLIKFSLIGWKRIFESWREITQIGVAAALGNAVNPFAIAIVYGYQVVAGFGVAGRLESFAVIPMLAMSGSIGPIAGQNWGAEKFDRVRGAVKFGFQICLIWSAVIAMGFWFYADALAAQFSDSTVVSEEATQYLLIVPITSAGYGITIVAAAAFNALGKPMLGLFLYLVRSVFCTSRSPSWRRSSLAPEAFMSGSPLPIFSQVWSSCGLPTAG